MGRQWAIILLTAAGILAAVSCSKDRPDDPRPAPGPETIPVFDLENPTVRAYLDILERFPYRDGDYSYSRIDEYYQSPTTYRKDHPFPATVTWTWDRETVSQRLYVSGDEDFSTSFSWPVSARAGSYDIYTRQAVLLEDHHHPIRRKRQGIECRKFRHRREEAFHPDRQCLQCT